MLINTFRIFKKVFPNFSFTTYVNELGKILGDCRSVLDLGCGVISPISFLDIEYSVGVDCCESTISEAKKRGTHDEFCTYKVQDIGNEFSNKQFDCCVALDIIEHLCKEDGYKLIRDMEEIASKKVVIFTPNGFKLPYLTKNIDIDFEKHLSSWDTAEMKKLGYKVIGIYGYKPLRGRAYSLRFHPKIIWGIISELTHYPELTANFLFLKGNLVDTRFVSFDKYVNLRPLNQLFLILYRRTPCEKPVSFRQSCRISQALSTRQLTSLSSLTVKLMKQAFLDDKSVNSPFFQDYLYTRFHPEKAAAILCVKDLV